MLHIDIIINNLRCGNMIVDKITIKDHHLPSDFSELNIRNYKYVQMFIKNDTCYGLLCDSAELTNDYEPSKDLDFVKTLRVQIN